MKTIYEFYKGEAFGKKWPHFQNDRYFPFTVFVYVCEGIYYCTSQGMDLAVKEGETLVVPPYTCHNIRMENNGLLHWAHISLNADDNIVSCGQSMPYVIDGADSERIGWCLRELNSLSGVTDEIRRTVLKDRYIAEIFDIVLNLYMQSSSPTKELDDIYYLIRRFPGEKYTLSMLSVLAHMSERSFEKKFKDEYKKSPMQYVSECRIKYASFLLLTEKRVKEVARKTGYYDTYHFSKQFKKTIGVSPTEYARTHSIEV